MKIKRFTARSMREAIRLVREEQGPDAVILSNRRVEDGIEVVAATDYDAALIQQSLPSAAEIAEAPLVRAAPRPAPSPAEPAPVVAGLDLPPLSAPAASVPEPLMRELGDLRRLLQQQLEVQGWEQFRQRHPLRLGVLRALSQLGLPPELARELAAELPADASAERARFLPLGWLARRLPVAAPDVLLRGTAQGPSVIALVGPTGVGKTTTLAKIAARFIQRHGLRDLALISTDTLRVGAQEQLATYGRLLGVPVLAAGTAEELSQALDKLRDRKLVLIDTAGQSPRDRSLARQFACLDPAGRAIKTLLVLPANSGTADLEEVVRGFAPAEPVGCVITKLDEASRAGAVLGLAVQRQLPIHYFSDGQRVPEDLHPARAEDLVIRAVRLSREQAAIDDLELEVSHGAAPLGALMAGASHG
ncbi:MAG TPA: flagellar biosynthesis protein FlhF [Nevskiaceae bacterium]|nr:flagellar biosynthesis protein FlhF [Nevskiaceae bacterium]